VNPALASPPLGAAINSAASSALPYREAVLAAFTYDVPGDSPPDLIVKRNAMQDNGPLAVKILVTARRARSVPRASRDSILRATAPYNTSVEPDDDCPDAATWTLQQDLLFRVLILSDATAIRHVDSFNRTVQYRPRLTNPSCCVFERVRNDAILCRTTSPLGFDKVNAPSLQLLHHAVGSIGADLPEQLSLARLLSPPPGLEHAGTRKHYIDQLCASARGTQSLHGFSLHATTGISKCRSTISTARVLKEVERIERSPESCSALSPSESADKHSPCSGLFLTTFDLEESRTARGHHARAVEVMEDVVAAVAQSGLVRLSNQPDHGAPAAHAQLDFNSVWTAPLSGFGSSKVQLYGKTIVTDTALHDEIADSAAVNHSTLSSRGVSVWVGCCPRDLVGRVAAADRPRLLERLHTMISMDGFNYAELLDLVLSTGTVPRVVFQLPGETVLTPSGLGAAHAVLGVGSQMLNLAINLSTSPSACDATMSFWEDFPAVLFNSSLATRTIFPGMWLKEVRHWPLQHPFWSQQIAAVTAVVAAARARCTSPQGVLVYTRRFDGAEDDARRFCMSEILPPGTNPEGYVPLSGDRHCCGVEILWLSINGMCVHCFYQGHSLMQSAGPSPAPHYPHMNAAGRRNGFQRPALPHQLDQPMYRVTNSGRRGAPVSPLPPPPPPPPPSVQSPVHSAAQPTMASSAQLAEDCAEIDPPSIWAQLATCAMSAISLIRLACCAGPPALAAPACAYAPLSQTAAADEQRAQRPRDRPSSPLRLPPAAPPAPPHVPAPPSTRRSGQRRDRAPAAAASAPAEQSMAESNQSARPKRQRVAAAAAGPAAPPTMTAVENSIGAAAPEVEASAAAAAAAAAFSHHSRSASAAAAATPSGGRPRRQAANLAADRTRKMVASEASGGPIDGPSDGEHIDDSPPQSDEEEQKGKRSRPSQNRKNQNTFRKKPKHSNSKTVTERERVGHPTIPPRLRKQWDFALLMSTVQWEWKPMLPESAQVNGWNHTEPVGSLQARFMLCSMSLETGVCKNQRDTGFTLSPTLMHDTVQLLHSPMHEQTASQSTL